MEPVMLDAHLTHLANEGTFDDNVRVTLAYSPDFVEGEGGKGKTDPKAHTAIRKRYTVAKGQACLLITTHMGVLEITEGDTLDLHRTINDRTVGVYVTRNSVKGSVYGRFIATSCRDIKTLLPR